MHLTWNSVSCGWIDTIVTSWSEGQYKQLKIFYNSHVELAGSFLCSRERLYGENLF
jgi:hypothetical protein